MLLRNSFRATRRAGPISIRSQSRIASSAADDVRGNKGGPKESEAQLHLKNGRELLARHDYSKAFDLFNQAIQKDAGLAWAYVERAEAANNLHRYDQGIADCTEAIRLGPAG